MRLLQTVGDHVVHGGGNLRAVVDDPLREGDVRALVSERDDAVSGDRGLGRCVEGGRRSVRYWKSVRVAVGRVQERNAARSGERPGGGVTTHAVDVHGRVEGRIVDAEGSVDRLRLVIRRKLEELALLEG